MSLVSLILRLATVKALQGATFAGGRVYDSAISPLDTHVLTEKSPVLVVYTEEETTDLKGTSFLNGARELSLVIQCIVAGVPEGQGEEIEIPPTDEGLEALLDFIRYDVLKALQYAQSPWATLWRQMVFGVKSLKTRRGASSDHSTRFAAHELIFTLDTLADPFPGETPVIWEEILGFLKNEAEFSGFIKPIKERLEI